MKVYVGGRLSKFKSSKKKKEKKKMKVLGEYYMIEVFSLVIYIIEINFELFLFYKSYILRSLS